MLCAIYRLNKFSKETTKSKSTYLFTNDIVEFSNYINIVTLTLIFLV